MGPTIQHATVNHKRGPQKSIEHGHNVLRPTSNDNSGQQRTTPTSNAASANRSTQLLNPEAEIFTSRERDGAGEDEPNGEDNLPWHTVRRRKMRANNVVKGSKQSTGALKGVRDSKDLYVGRCNPDVKIEDIKNYVKDEAGIDVIYCCIISKDDAPVKAFKITVIAEDADKLLDPSIWPENIRVRKYFSRTSGRN